MNFLSDVVQFLLLHLSIFVTRPNQLKIFLKLFSALLLLLESLFLLLDLDVNLLLFGEAADGEMSTLAPRLQVGWDVLEQRVLGCHILYSDDIVHLDFARQEIFVENFAPPLGYSCDG